MKIFPTLALIGTSAAIRFYNVSELNLGPEESAVYDMNVTSFSVGELQCIDIGIKAGLRDVGVDDEAIE